MKKFKKFLSVLLTLSLIFSLGAVSMSGQAATEDSKDLVVYFSNWGEDTVEGLPWDRLSYINHAFWEINPVDGQENTYTIDSTDAAADVAYFAQYEEMSKTYPDVNVMISIGGWTRCGYFSEMANTAEGRQSFIDSCIETMNTYTFLDGIDIDWEYPGVARSGDGVADEGCPVVGDDYTNYTLLLKEMREAFDAEYGIGGKKLTACASVNVGTLAKQNIGAIAEYLDLINVMSYDMTGSYDPMTGHQSALYATSADGFSVVNGVNYCLQQGMPASKINIGSPLYCHGWGGVTADENGNVVGVPGSGEGYVGDLTWDIVKALELKAVEVGTPGWHKGYDETAQAAYLWNDDPNSKYYQNFLTYDSEESLQAKLDYINEVGLAGIIVWEASGDSEVDDYPMLSQMSKSLGLYDGELPKYGQAGQIPVIDETRPSTDLPDPMTETVQGWGENIYPYGTYIYYADGVADDGIIGSIWMSINDNSSDWVDNLPDGAWGASCWEKVFDVKEYVSQEDKGYWDWAAYEGEYIFYDPDGDLTGGIYYAKADTSNTANDAPDGIWNTNWQYITTLTIITTEEPEPEVPYEPKYADGATVATLEADPLYYGEFSPKPFEWNGETVDTYVAGSIVSYNGKYYEAYADSSAWNNGWEPDVHANWHEITIIEEPATNVYCTFKVGMKQFYHSYADEFYTADTSCRIINNRTYLPIRLLSQITLTDILYDADTKGISMTSPSNIKIDMVINSTTATLTAPNGETATMEINAPVTSDGSAYLPVREISMAVGYPVYYIEDGSDKYVVVSMTELTEAEQLAAAQAGASITE